MIPVQIRFTKKIIEHVDKLVDSGVYSNRSEAIRDATRRLVVGTALGDFSVPHNSRSAK
jgi:Arc/MetJ-type ribon-helix-helix transcriptional regulator